MTNNNKMLLWGSAAVLLLATAIVFLFLNLSGAGDRGSFEVGEGGITVYHGIPSDAVAVLDFKRFDEYSSMVADTSSFLYGMPDAESSLVQIQEHLKRIESLKGAPLVFSMHYSAKNSVSFLQITDLAAGAHDDVARLLQQIHNSRKKYNGVTVYTVCGDAVAAVHNNLLLASSSSYVLESAIRHLENSTSVLDKQEFDKLLRANGLSSCIYINHNQIGKFFSGVIERGFLGYSDFVMKFASWSCMKINGNAGKFTLTGALENFSDESRFSNIYENQGVKSFTGRIVSGDAFITDTVIKKGIVDKFSPFAVDMESAAVGQCAFLNKVPFVSVRCISDNADDDGAMSFDEFEKIATNRVAQVVLEMIEIL